MDIYTQNIMDHARAPRNYGTMKGSTIRHREANSSCGDTIFVELKLNEEMIKDFRFEIEGCAISKAATSILSEQIKGMRQDQALDLTLEDLNNFLGVKITDRRKKCALLGLLAAQNAILKTTGENRKDFFDLSRSPK